MLLYTVPDTSGKLMFSPCVMLRVTFAPPDAGTAVTSKLATRQAGGPMLNWVSPVLGSNVGLSNVGWSVHVLFAGISKSANVSPERSVEPMIWYSLASVHLYPRR